MISQQVSEYAREQMVAQQVRAWDVLDNGILDLLRGIRREEFVPEAYREAAYADMPIPLPHGQHMLAPSVVGRIIQAVEVRPGEQVLEVGTGSGFLSACFALQGAKLRTVEIFPEIAALARHNLAAHPDIELVEADALSLPAEANRYDVIVITGSLPLADARFENQLKSGGRLFVVVGEGAAMEARLVRREVGGGLTVQSLFETVLDPLVNAARRERFRF